MIEITSETSQAFPDTLVQERKQALEEILNSFEKGEVSKGHKQIDILIQSMGDSACAMLARCVDEKNAYLVWDLMQTRIKPEDVNHIRALLDHPFIHEYKYGEIRKHILLTIQHFSGQQVSQEQLLDLDKPPIRYLNPSRSTAIGMGVEPVFPVVSVNDLIEGNIGDAVLIYHGSDYFTFGYAGIVAHIYPSPREEAYLTGEDEKITVSALELTARIDLQPLSEYDERNDLIPYAVSLFTLGISRFLDAMEPNDIVHRRIPQIKAIYGTTNLRMAKALERYGFKVSNPDVYQSRLNELQQELDLGRISMYQYNEQYRQLLNTEGIVIVASVPEVSKRLRQEWHDGIVRGIATYARQQHTQQMLDSMTTRPLVA